MRAYVSSTFSAYLVFFAVLRQRRERQRRKELFMVRQIYLWPIYFYGQQKIYYFDLLGAIA